MTEKKLSKKEKALICATSVGAGIAGYFGVLSLYILFSLKGGQKNVKR